MSQFVLGHQSAIVSMQMQYVGFIFWVLYRFLDWYEHISMCGRVKQLHWRIWSQWILSQQLHNLAKTTEYIYYKTSANHLDQEWIDDTALHHSTTKWTLYKN